ncbi:MAG: AbrB/MazE/SpoVT family DNA-binding domain-containing protein [Methyloceanibacter sp.]|uniref:AbrB/MazE/SpoVT family DNA-binding domain-containing protein n=1 Tax=Methyloceanibacter sp. TaxID=1965321 RepID=UPI003D6D0FAE
MKVKIAKWGNSLAVRLPKAVVEEVGLKPDTEVDVTVQQGEVRVKRLRPRYTLEDMIAAIKPGTKAPPSVEWGPDRGSEILPEDEYSRGEITPENIHEHAARRRRHRLG